MKELAEVFSSLNRMKREGVLQEYAIGGAMAFLFYAEPLATYDLDVFIHLPGQSGPVLSLDSLYNWLRNEGYQTLGEHVLMHGIPVQFLVSDVLAEEAIDSATEQDFEGVTVRVMTPEFLIAMSVQAGGGKRRERVKRLLEARDVDMEKAKEIMRRHGLLARWQEDWAREHE